MHCLEISIYISIYTDLTCIFKASCYSARLSWGASSNLGQPFRPRQKQLDLDWGKNRLSGYDIRAEGALPPSITVIAIIKKLCYWICNVSRKRINSKIEICALSSREREREKCFI